MHITGRKMSKSLKNFVTVRDFLGGSGHPDDLRVFCLQYHYRSDVHYAPERLAEARAIRTALARFVARAAALAAEAGAPSPKGSWGPLEADLFDACATAETTVPPLFFFLLRPPH